MELMPLLAALAAAIAGACAWAGLIAGTGYEIGFLAWGIGGLVGFAALRAGGRGIGLAVMCGVFCLIAIVGGKWLAYRYIVNETIKSEMAAAITPEIYGEMKIRADDFAKLASTEDHAAFMAENGFATDATTAGEVTAEELVDFRMNIAPMLTELAQAQPDFETWQHAQIAGFSAEYMGSMESNEMFGEMFSVIDLLFLFLGVSTAFGMVKRATDEEGGA